MTHPTPAARPTSRIAVFLTLFALLVACGGGNEDSPDPVTEGDLVESLPPAKGDVDLVRWNLPSEPDTLDPANTVTYSSGTVVRSVCDSLLTREPDLTLEPNLAD